MTDQSQTLKEQTSQASTSATSSQGLGDGPSPLSWQGGLQLDLFGQAPAPASPSATQENRVEPTTPDIYSLSSDASSRSATLQQLLENRLRQNLEGRGSPEYVVTFKHWAMGSELPIFAARASGRRTSDNASTGLPPAGWTTPQAMEPNARERPSRAATGRTTDYLGRQVHTLSGWPTPRANKIEGYSRADFSPTLYQVVTLAGWPTPSANQFEQNLEAWEERKKRNLAKGYNGNGQGATLDIAAKQAGWATPQSRDYRSAEGNKPRWENPDRSRNLNDQVKALSGWGTPTAQDAKHATLSPSEIERDPNVLRNQVHLSGWPTPDSSNVGDGQPFEKLKDNMDARRLRTKEAVKQGEVLQGSGRSMNLAMAASATRAGWPTPQVVDSGKLGNRPNYGQVGLSNHPGLRGFPDRPPMKKSRSGDGQSTQPLGTEPSTSTASTVSHGALNPEFPRWLMGFPDGWSSYAPTATRSSRKSQRSS